MNKTYYLLFTMLWSITGSAANCVSVTKVSANYKTQQVTFKLTWTGCNGTTHLNKVWCFVDFQPVDASGNKGVWQRATISGTPSVTNGTYAAGNTTGFYVTGSNGQSATVTVKLGNASGKFKWCATATDYPPQMIINSATAVTLKGTTPFAIKYTDNTTDVINTKTYSLQMGKTLASINDATSAPGSIQCLTRDNVAVNGYCCSGQTIVNGYCRNLSADGAYSDIRCGVEIVKSETVPAGSGWKRPNYTQALCIIDNSSVYALGDCACNHAALGDGWCKGVYADISPNYAMMFWWGYGYATAAFGEWDCACRGSYYVR